MIECPIPQDILKYKAKFVGGFTAREAASLAVGAVLGILGYTLFGKYISNTTMKICLVAAFAAPAFAFGFVKPLGQPIEKIAWAVIRDNFICAPKLFKEIRHPELEKYEAQKAFQQTEMGKKKTNQGKIKVKASKQYKAIH